MQVSLKFMRITLCALLVCSVLSAVSETEATRKRREAIIDLTKSSRALRSDLPENDADDSLPETRTGPKALEGPNSRRSLTSFMAEGNHLDDQFEDEDEQDSAIPEHGQLNRRPREGAFIASNAALPKTRTIIGGNSRTIAEFDEVPNDEADSSSLSEDIEDGMVRTSDLVQILFKETEFAKQLHRTEAALMMVAHSTVSVSSRVALMDAYAAMANLVLAQLSKVITETDIAKARIKLTNTAVACNTDEDYAAENGSKCANPVEVMTGGGVLGSSGNSRIVEGIEEDDEQIHDIGLSQTNPKRVPIENRALDSDVLDLAVAGSGINKDN